MGGIAGDAVARFATEQLEAERAAKSSLEQRGLTVLTTSGVIASIAGIASRGANFPIVAVVLLILGLCGFATAAVLGVLVALPRIYHEADEADLARWLDRPVWEADGSLALMRMTQKRLDLITGFRKGNQSKAELLMWAIRALVFAVLLLLVSVIILFAFAAEA